mgnify:CR=1 FL=1
MLKEGRDRRMITRCIKPEITIAHKYGSSGIIKSDVMSVLYTCRPDRSSSPVLPLGRPGSNAELGSLAIARVTRLSVVAFSPESLFTEEHV